MSEPKSSTTPSVDAVELRSALVGKRGVGPDWREQAGGQLLAAAT